MRAYPAEVHTHAPLPTPYLPTPTAPPTYTCTCCSSSRWALYQLPTTDCLPTGVHAARARAGRGALLAATEEGAAARQGGDVLRLSGRGHLRLHVQPKGATPAVAGS